MRERTFYFYDEADELVLSVDCDADGKCKEVSTRRTEADGQVVYWTSRLIDGTVIATSVDHFRESRLVSDWGCDGEGRIRSEKHFQYAGNKLFKSVSFYYAARQIVERWITSYDSEGRISQTFGLTGAGHPLGDGRYVYEYDEEGRKKYVWSFNDLDPSDVPNALTIYEYDCDDQGNWTEQRRFHQFRSETSWRLTKTIRRLTYFQS